MLRRTPVVVDVHPRLDVFKSLAVGIEVRSIAGVNNVLAFQNEVSTLENGIGQRHPSTLLLKNRTTLPAALHEVRTDKHPCEGLATPVRFGPSAWSIEPDSIASEVAVKGNQQPGEKRWFPDA